MNILQVNMSLDPVTGGGTVERVRQLHTALRETEGVSSRILSLAVGLSAGTADDRDITLLPCLNRRWYLPLPKLLTIWRQVKWADAVILVNHWTLLNAVVYWMVRLAGKPYLVSPAGALLMFGRSQLFKRLYNAVIGRSLIANADAAIAIAADEAVDIQQYGVPADRIHHIPNGVRIDDFACADDNLFRRHAGLGEDVDYLLFIGRLNSIKGPDLLLEAFIRIAASHPGVHLVYIGPDGGLLAALKARIEDVNLSDRVHFTGYAGGDLKSSAIHGASMLVVPSRQEAMSIVALEAAVCGTPVVLTDRCGFETLPEAGGGRLVEAGEESIAEAIGELLDRPDLREAMRQRGRELALREFTWSIAAGRLHTLIGTLERKRAE